MLRLLSVTNFATIDHLELELKPGFNVLTGETGAGKSIIIDALSLVLGERADSTMIRSGAQQTMVEGVFILNEDIEEVVSTILDEYGLGDGEEELILAREVNLEGRNTCRVNGKIVPLKLLNSIGERLVDIHGQGQHISLLRVREHVGILDRYAGLGGLQVQVAKLVKEIRDTRRELETLQQDERDLARRIDLLKHQITEITDSHLNVGEDDELINERTVLSNAERIQMTADQAYRVLYGDGSQSASAFDLFSEVTQDLAQLEDLDPSLKELRETSESLTYQVEDMARTLRSYRDRIEYNPERLQQVEERLDHISQLKRKYGDSVEEVLAYAERASEELDSLTHNEERIEQLKAAEERLLYEAGALASQLSQARKEAAVGLSTAIENELAGLAMAGTRMSVDFQHIKSEDGLPVILGDENGGDTKHIAFDSTGIDKIEFLVSPNPGESIRPLAKIASGGETSRLMLAIKAILSNADQIPILIFDEIDYGIGGRIGAVVGKKLWSLSARHQVLCVTHLPQIACFADHHFSVGKSVNGGRTATWVTQVIGEDRVEEISHMLGSTSQTSWRNAQEMLERASQLKEQ